MATGTAASKSSANRNHHSKSSGSSASSQAARPANSTATPTRDSATEWTPQDKRLVAYIREQAPYLVSALTASASRAGDGMNWLDMQQYLAMATEISTLCGLPRGNPQATTITGSPTLTRAAGAGGRGS